MLQDNQNQDARTPGIKIECDNISKAFHVPGQDRLLHVLDRVSLQVYENEFLVILGPGQSGKTVLLNCIAGLIEPSAGETRINGRPITRPRPRIAAWCFSVTRSFRGKRWNTTWPSGWPYAACR